MKKLIIMLLTLAGVSAFAQDSTAPGMAAKPTDPREKILFDENWKFALGNAADPAKDFQYLYGMPLAKVGASGDCACGAVLADFDDSAWRTVDLPHDWAVELPFTADPKYYSDVPWRVMGHGFKPVGPYFPDTSIGWYRKSFEIPKSDEGRRISIAFDGSFRDTEVWLNNYRIGRHEGGYCGFRFDLTDYLNYGGKNVLSVRVDATKYEGWFYEGAGIYRHVWLEKTNPVHIAPYGVHVLTQIAPDMRSAEAGAQVSVADDGASSDAVTTTLTVLDPAGRIVGSATPPATVHITQPQLWSLESPVLYRMVVQLKSGNELVDQEETAFGLRTMKFDPEKGFLLNGRRVSIRGACNHQDHAGVGIAVPDALLEWRLKQLKKWGFNAYRTSHNPPAPELLALCDKLGILVLDENRSIGATDDILRDLRFMIERDRNHPSVIAWSLGNEEVVQATPQAARFGATMRTLAHQLDNTRPVTFASNSGGNLGGIMSQLDLYGINYTLLGNQFDQMHQAHPQLPIWATEEASTLCTRGIYSQDGARGYMSAYDASVPGWGKTAESWVQYFAARPWLAGAFVWTGFDYRGEPTPYSWPCISSHFGVLDTCGFPKDNAWYYKACWSEEPVLHLLPHWNWPGREGKEIDVRCFSNLDEVELFLNGQSLGRKPVPKLASVNWKVKYAPGKLSATGYKQGNAVAHTEVDTTGEPAGLLAEVSRQTLQAGGCDCAIINIAACDAQGRVVPTADIPVSFKVSSNARILGVGNGDPSCHEPDIYTNPSSTTTLPLQWQDAATKQNISTAKMQITTENTSADYQSEFDVTGSELAGLEIATLHIQSIDDEGTITVNGVGAGESHDWQTPFSADIAGLLKAGKNVIVAHVHNIGGAGGMTGATGITMTTHAATSGWMRSTFNGWCQVIVASPKKPGTVQLNVTSPGLVSDKIALKGI